MAEEAKNIYNYLDEELDADKYVSNLLHNADSYIRHMGFTEPQAEAFRSSLQDYIDAIGEGRLSTGMQGVVTDSAGILADNPREYTLRRGRGRTVTQQRYDSLNRRRQGRAEANFRPNNAVARYMENIAGAMSEKAKGERKEVGDEGKFDWSKGLWSSFMRHLQPNGAPNLNAWLDIDPYDEVAKRRGLGKRMAKFGEFLNQYIDTLPEEMDFSGVGTGWTRDDYVAKLRQLQDKLNSGQIDNEFYMMLEGLGANSELYMPYWTTKRRYGDEESAVDERAERLRKAVEDTMAAQRDRWYSQKNTFYRPTGGPQRVAIDSHADTPEKVRLSFETNLKNHNLKLDPVSLQNESGSSYAPYMEQLDEVYGDDLFGTVQGTGRYAGWRVMKGTYNPSNGSVLVYRPGSGECGRVFAGGLDTNFYNMYYAQLEQGLLQTLDKHGKPQFGDGGDIMSAARGGLLIYQSGGELTDEEAAQMLAWLQQTYGDGADKSAGNPYAGNQYAGNPESMNAPESMQGYGGGSSGMTFDDWSQSASGIGSAIRAAGEVPFLSGKRSASEAWENEGTGQGMGLRNVDKARLTAMAMDILGMIDPEGISSAALFYGSDLTSLGADLSDPDVTKTQAFTNFGLNALLSTIGFLPVLGGMGKTGSLIKTASKLAKPMMYAGIAMGVFDTISNGPEVIKSLGKLLGSKDGSEESKMTLNDWRNIYVLASTLIGGTHAIRHTRARNVARRVGSTNDVLVAARNANTGEEAMIHLKGADASAARAARSKGGKEGSEELGKILDRFNKPEGAADTFKSGWEPLETTTRSQRKFFGRELRPEYTEVNWDKVVQTYMDPAKMTAAAKNYHGLTRRVLKNPVGYSGYTGVYRGEAPIISATAAAASATPVTGTPVTEVPKTETPKTETPKTETPKKETTEVPKKEENRIKIPAGGSDERDVVKDDAATKAVKDIAFVRDSFKPTPSKRGIDINNRIARNVARSEFRVRSAGNRVADATAMAAAEQNGIRFTRNETDRRADRALDKILNKNPNFFTENGRSTDYYKARESFLKKGDGIADDLRAYGRLAGTGRGHSAAGKRIMENYGLSEREMWNLGLFRLGGVFESQQDIMDKIDECRALAESLANGGTVKKKILKAQNAAPGGLKPDMSNVSDILDGLDPNDPNYYSFLTELASALGRVLEASGRNIGGGQGQNAGQNYTIDYNNFKFEDAPYYQGGEYGSSGPVSLTATQNASYGTQHGIGAGGGSSVNYNWGNAQENVDANNAKYNDEMKASDYANAIGTFFSDPNNAGKTLSDFYDWYNGKVRDMYQFYRHIAEDKDENGNFKYQGANSYFRGKDVRNFNQANRALYASANAVGGINGYDENLEDVFGSSTAARFLGRRKENFDLSAYDLGKIDLSKYSPEVQALIRQAFAEGVIDTNAFVGKKVPNVAQNTAQTNTNGPDKTNTQANNPNDASTRSEDEVGEDVAGGAGVGTDWGAIAQDIAPDLLRVGNLARTLGYNRWLERQRPWLGLDMPHETHEQVIGDYGAMMRGNKQAAQIASRARRAAGADIDRNTAAMLDATIAGGGYREQGAVTNDEALKQSIERARTTAAQNLAERARSASENYNRLNTYNQTLLANRMAARRTRTESLNNFQQGFINRIEAKREEDRPYREQYENMALQNELASNLVGNHIIPDDENAADVQKYFDGIMGGTMKTTDIPEDKRELVESAYARYREAYYQRLAAKYGVRYTPYYAYQMERNRVAKADNYSDLFSPELAQGGEIGSDTKTEVQRMRAKVSRMQSQQKHMEKRMDVMERDLDRLQRSTANYIAGTRKKI